MQPFPDVENKPIVQEGDELIHPLRAAKLEEIEYENMKKLISEHPETEILADNCPICNQEFKEDEVVLVNTDFSKKKMYLVHTQCQYELAKSMKGVSS